MKICLLQVGKTHVNYIQTGIDEYKKRLVKFIDYEEITVSEAKKKIVMSPIGDALTRFPPKDAMFLICSDETSFKYFLPALNLPAISGCDFLYP